MEGGQCLVAAGDEFAPAGVATVGQLRGDLDALRRHLERGERQLADFAWQLADLTSMGASPADKRSELARLTGWAREAAGELERHRLEAREAAAAAAALAEPEPASGFDRASSSGDSAAEGEDEEDSGGSEDDGELWQVVAGSANGGILVRESVEFSSNAATERLATGSLVRELSRDGERLQYELVSGSGPQKGWVSVRVKERDLLVKKEPARTASGCLKGPYGRLILWPRGRRHRPPRNPERKFRRVCVLGPFNSGTNAIMRELPRFFDAKVINKHRADNPSFWKHGIQKPSASWPKDVFFICMVRDPGYWINSLARDPRDGTFNDFVPVKRMFHRSGKSRYEEVEPRSASQLFSEVDFDGKVYKDALMVWEATVWSYFDRKIIPREQMLVLRYEDYVFRFGRALRVLAKRGLQLLERHPPFVAMKETAKDHTHPTAARRDLSTTRQDLTDKSVRYRDRTRSEMQRLRSVDPELVRLLGYGEDAVDRWVA